MKPEIVNKEALSTENSIYNFNNHGEASKKNSSHSSFNTMLEGFFPQPQPHTSPEEKDVSGSSPDYYNENESTVKSEYKKDKYSDQNPRETEEYDYSKDDLKEKADRAEKAEDKSDAEYNAKKEDKTEKTPEEDHPSAEKKDDSESENVKENDKNSETTEEKAESSDGNKEKVSESSSENKENIKEEEDIPEAIKEIRKAISDIIELLKNNTDIELDEGEKTALLESLEKSLTVFNDYLKKNENTDSLEESLNILSENQNLIKDFLAEIETIISPANEDYQNPDLNDLSEKLNNISQSLQNMLKTPELTELSDLNEITLAEQSSEDTNNNLSTVITSAEAAKNSDQLSKIEEQDKLTDLKAAEGEINSKQETLIKEQPVAENKPEKEDQKSDLSHFKFNNEAKIQKTAEKPENIEIKGSEEIKTEDIKTSDNSSLNSPLFNDQVVKESTDTLQTKSETKTSNDISLTENLKTINTEKNADTQNVKQTQNTAKENLTSYLTKAFDAEKSIMEKITTQATLRLKGDSKEINIQLAPKELGNVNISIVEKDGLITGKIKVDSDAIKEIVETNISQLRRTLGDEIKIDKIDVEVREDSEFSKNSMLYENKQNKNNLSDNTADNTGYGNFNQENVIEENISLNLDLPKGVIETNGMLSVDLIG